MKISPRLPKSFALGCASLSFVFSPLARSAERIEELAKMLPPNSTIIFCVKNNPELVKDWDASGVGRFIVSEEAKNWIVSMYDKDGTPKWDSSTKKQSGMSFRESISINPGATAVGFDFSPLIDGSGKEPVVVEISDMSGKEKELEAAFAKKLEARKKHDFPNAVLKKVDVAGVSATVLAKDDSEKATWIIGSAVVDGIQIETPNQAAMEKAIASVKSGGEATKKVEQLARVAELNGATSDITILADLETLIAALQKKMMEDAGKADGPGAMFNPAMFLGILGLEELKAAALTLDLADERSTANFILLHTDKPTGILPSLLRGTGNEVPQPAFVPAGADQASVGRQSFGNIYDALMTAVQKLGPMAAMLTMQLDQMEQKVGMSLRKDLFGSMDDVITQAQSLKVGAGGLPEVSQVTAIKLKDRERFQAALSALLAIAGNGFGVFEESEIEGQKVHTLKPSLAGAATPDAAKGGTQIAYAVTEDQLLFCQGSQEMLQKVLARIASKAKDGSIWDEPASQGALDAMPKGYTSMSVSNGASIMKTMASVVTQLQSMNPAGSKKLGAAKKGPKSGKPGSDEAPAAKSDDSPTFDAKAMPTEEVFARFFGTTASGGYSENDATMIKFIALPPAK